MKSKDPKVQLIFFNIDNFLFLDILVYLLESCNEAIQQRSPYTESLSAEVLQSLECEEKEFCKVR